MEKQQNTSIITYISKASARERGAPYLRKFDYDVTVRRYGLSGETVFSPIVSKGFGNDWQISLLLPGISQQQTIFLSDLRFFVQWFHGSIVQSICDCNAIQSAVCFSKCLAAAPVFLLGAVSTR